MIGLTVFIVGALIVGIWVFVEVKRLRHKLFAMFLIGLILFSYISFIAVIKGQDIDMKTVPGFIEAGKLYFVWLGGVFSNIKTITSHTIHMDWSLNDSQT